MSDAWMKTEWGWNGPRVGNWQAQIYTGRDPIWRVFKGTARTGCTELVAEGPVRTTIHAAKCQAARVISALSGSMYKPKETDDGE